MSKQHIVKQGECLSSIAAQYGFRDYKLIYNHPDNQEFKQQRPNPNIIFPGDQILIPDKIPKVQSVATDNSHTFRIPVQRRILRLRLLDTKGKAIANEPTTITPSGKPPIKETTNSKGIVEIPVDAGSKEAELVILDHKLKLNLAHLNPVTETPDEGISGIQARLHNLGYYNGPITNELNLATRIGVSLFQKDMELEVDAELTQATIDKLIDEHGC